MTDTVVGAWRTNCYFLTNEAGTLIVDPGDEADRLIAALRSMHSEPIGMVSTHAHCDHIGAVRKLHSALGVPSMIHRDDVVMAADPHLSGFDEEPINKDYAITAWDRVLVDGDVIEWGSDALTVLHTPGHTPGSVCLWDKRNNLLYTGDTLFFHTIGRTDFLLGDWEAMKRTLLFLGTLPADLTVLPGHGDPTTLDAEFRRNPLLGHISPHQT